jgi:TM2 domain-containing membrane protein YozV/ribosomal protein L32
MLNSVFLFNNSSVSRPHRWRRRFRRSTNQGEKMSMVFCRGCGKEIHETAVTCPNCGAPQGTPKEASNSDKRILPAALLCFFLGVFGIHRFYVGKIGTGILQLLTFGGLGIWALIDFIMIVVGSFTDKDGNTINLWT